MNLGDVDEVLRTLNPGHPHEQLHGHLARLAVAAGQQFAVPLGQAQRRPRQGARRHTEIRLAGRRGRRGAVQVQPVSLDHAVAVAAESFEGTAVHPVERDRPTEHGIGHERGAGVGGRPGPVAPPEGQRAFLLGFQERRQVQPVRRQVEQRPEVLRAVLPVGRLREGELFGDQRLGFGCLVLHLEAGQQPPQSSGQGRKIHRRLAAFDGQRVAQQRLGLLDSKSGFQVEAQP